MNDINYNALGQAIDSSWGRTSTPQTASYSVKISLAGAGRLAVSYMAVVNFATEKEMIAMKRLYTEESQRVVSAALGQVKDVYKDLTGKGLRLTEGSPSDSFEIIGFGVHNPKRTAYYRRRSLVELG